MRKFCVVMTAWVLSGCVTTYSVTPVATENQETRYVSGTPTTLSHREHGSIEVTPFGVDDKGRRLLFGVAAFNRNGQAANFGVENLALGRGAQTLKIYTANELIAEAKRDAAIAAIALALAGAAAAYSATQNAQQTTSGYFISPRGGVSTFSATTYDPTAATLGVASASAATGYGIAQISGSLDSTIASVKGSVLQTTTIDPGASFGGEIVADRPTSGVKYPEELTLSVRWNGDEHVFRYVMDKAPN